MSKGCRSLCIKVEIIKPADVNTAAADMLELSRELHCDITSYFDGTMIFCYPNEEVDQIVERWNAAFLAKQDMPKATHYEVAQERAYKEWLEMRAAIPNRYFDPNLGLAGSIKQMVKTIEDNIAEGCRDSAKIASLKHELANHKKNDEIQHEIWHQMRVKVRDLGMDEYGGLDGMLDELIAKYKGLLAEKEAGKFWADIFNDCDDPEYNQKPLREKIELELLDYHNFMDGIPRIFMAVTGDRISKVNTDPDAVIGEFEQEVERRIAEAIKDNNRANYDILMAALEEAFGPDPTADDAVDDGVTNAQAEYWICPKAKECDMDAYCDKQCVHKHGDVLGANGITCVWPDGEMKEQDFNCVRCDREGNPLPVKIEEARGGIEFSFLSTDGWLPTDMVCFDPETGKYCTPNPNKKYALMGRIIKILPTADQGVSKIIVQRSN